MMTSLTRPTGNFRGSHLSSGSSRGTCAIRCRTSGNTFSGLRIGTTRSSVRHRYTRQTGRTSIPSRQAGRSRRSVSTGLRLPFVSYENEYLIWYAGWQWSGRFRLQVQHQEIPNPILVNSGVTPMRWTIGIGTSLLILWLAYAVWPFFTVYRLAERRSGTRCCSGKRARRFPCPSQITDGADRENIPADDGEGWASWIDS